MNIIKLDFGPMLARISRRVSNPSRFNIVIALSSPLSIDGAPYCAVGFQLDEPYSTVAELTRAFRGVCESHVPRNQEVH